MKTFENGVSFYTKGQATVTVYFPENDVCCFHCSQRYKDSTDRQMCRLMSKELYNVYGFIHEDCPLIMEVEK